MLYSGASSPIAVLKDQGDSNHINNEVPDKPLDVLEALEGIKQRQRARR